MSLASSPQAIYNLEHWSQGYFQVDSSGRLIVAASQTPLTDVLEKAREGGLNTPLLVRFPHILHDRIDILSNAFVQAIDRLGYPNRFTCVYPIKVNQQRRVVEEVIVGQERALGRLGLEAGSKAELIAVLYATQPGRTTIVCNGYKDREYVELALAAEQLGYRVFIVIEKANELELVLEAGRRLDVRPRIGVRARLATIGKGNWQNTGGDKSKFGLSALAIIDLVERLREVDALACLEMLHVHLGSQIANIRDIQTGLMECAAFFKELCAAGAPIGVVDVGGGLGVDYEGTRSRRYCSINYSLEEYAFQVVRNLYEAAREACLAPPEIVTESGRAITAHHAVLISDVIDIEHRPRRRLGTHPPGDTAGLLDEVERLYTDLVRGERSVIEIYHEGKQVLAEAHQRFSFGQLGLAARADIEGAVIDMFHQVRARLDDRQRTHRELLDELNDALASKYFVNFSLFQSLPDVWAIDQIFPILPIDHLDKPIVHRAVIQDITCDSDGRIDLYVDGEGIESTLPLPDASGRPLYLGFFMVGAYQETLGDIHNLFGDTDSLDAVLTPDGNIELREMRLGDSTGSVLRAVNFEPDRIRAHLEKQIANAALSSERQRASLEAILSRLGSSTYLSAGS